jgi:hypothetical protein
MRSQVTFLIVNILILSACTPLSHPTFVSVQTALPSPIQEETQSAFTPTQGETPDMPSIPSAPTLQNLIEQAKADLAQRLSIPAIQITVLEVGEVVWPDSSLGCPQPGMMYAEVLTPGYLIRLNANDQEYEYHAGKSLDVFLCENPDPPVEGVPDNT